MTVDLAAEVKATEDERQAKSRIKTCSVGRALRELPELEAPRTADRGQLETYLDPDSDLPAIVVCETIARVWPEYKFGKTTLGQHRRRDCSCFRVKTE